MVLRTGLHFVVRVDLRIIWVAIVVTGISLYALRSSKGDFGSFWARVVIFFFFNIAPSVQLFSCKPRVLTALSYLSQSLAMLIFRGFQLGKLSDLGPLAPGISIRELTGQLELDFIIALGLVTGCIGNLKGRFEVDLRTIFVRLSWRAVICM